MRVGSGGVKKHKDAIRAAFKELKLSGQALMDGSTPDLNPDSSSAGARSVALSAYSEPVQPPKYSSPDPIPVDADTSVDEEGITYYVKEDTEMLPDWAEGGEEEEEEEDNGNDNAPDIDEGATGWVTEKAGNDTSMASVIEEDGSENSDSNSNAGGSSNSGSGSDDQPSAKMLARQQTAAAQRQLRQQVATKQKKTDKSVLGKIGKAFGIHALTGKGVVAALPEKERASVRRTNTLAAGGIDMDQLHDAIGVKKVTAEEVCVCVYLSLSLTLSLCSRSFALALFPHSLTHSLAHSLIHSFTAG